MTNSQRVVAARENQLSTPSCECTGRNWSDIRKVWIAGGKNAWGNSVIRYAIIAATSRWGIREHKGEEYAPDTQGDSEEASDTVTVSGR